MARPKTSILSRALIVEKALDIISKDGRKSLTLRRLARDLAVNPNSLYNHVANLDEVLDAIVKRIVGRMTTPLLEVEDWQEYLVATTLEYYDLLLAHPNAIYIIATRPNQRFSRPAYEHSIATLQKQSFPPEIALLIVEHISGSAVGAALLELEGGIQKPHETEKYPVITGALEAVQGFGARKRLEFGIRAFLVGISQPIEH